jgi:membrane-bound metal-dependent hydrolase YbcI (DUF457 family)
VFLGHLAIGLASKRLAPRASLGWLIAAPILVDVLWPVFLLLGWERVRIDPGNMPFTPLDFVSYPITHSLTSVFAWGLIFGGIYWLKSRDLRGMLVIAAGVVSHWVMDWITHRPDLPLYPGGPKYGLGLWNSIAGTLTVELIIFALGLWAYVSFTRPIDKTGRYALVAYVLFLLVIYFASLFGPPPPDERSLAFGALAQVLFIPWAWWLDRHRIADEPQRTVNIP